jgi:pimeloyl-ACP methyl ester carboxylesterase
MKEFFLKENGIYYRMNDFKPDRKTLVFVHGMSGSSIAWIRYEEKFSKEYNVLTYDIRGHGKSHRYKKYDDYEMNKFGEDLYDLVNFLKIKNFILIGHSYGVFVVFDFISKHKEYVDALVFLSPHFNVLKMPQARISKFILNIFRVIKFPIFIKKTRKHVDYSKYINSGDFNIPRTIADVGNTGLQVFIMCTRQTYILNYENLLSEIKVPVLIISGEKDSIFPNKYAQIMAQKILNAKIVTIKNTNHILVLNNFKEVGDTILEFVEKLK